MEPHIAQTIREVSDRIVLLTCLKNQLTTVYGELETDVPKEVVRGIIGRGIKENRVTSPWERHQAAVKAKAGAPTTRKAPAAKAEKSGVRGTAVMEAARALPDPFSPVQLSRACGLNPNSAAGACYRWRAAGLVKQVAKASYVKTAKFPGVKPEAKSVHVPGLDAEPEVSVEDQLERSLKARDAAVAAGNQVLARIHQDNIAKLEKRLH